MSDVIVIGVAGGTGSGKTTLVKALMNRFGDNISVLSHDNYYKRHDEMSYEERTVRGRRQREMCIRDRYDDRASAYAQKRPGHRLPDV